MESPIVGIILFVFLIFAVAHLTVITSSNLYRVKTSIDSNVLKNMEEDSEISIEEINCSLSKDLNLTTILLKNNGKLKLHIDELDVYAPDRFPRNESNRTINITSGTDILDPGLWNPKEIVNISLYKQFVNNTEYKFTITNEFGISVFTFCNATFT